MSKMSELALYIDEAQGQTFSYEFLLQDLGMWLDVSMAQAEGMVEFLVNGGHICEVKEGFRVNLHLGGYDLQESQKD